MTEVAPCDRIFTASVLELVELCREHFCLRLKCDRLADAAPGQFVHLKPDAGGTELLDELTYPLLRRAFSIASLDRGSDGVEFSVIFRVVGSATQWMRGLSVGESVSVLGPLGNSFPIEDKKHALMVAGGVGLPPMLWLAESLRAHGKTCVAFYGAQCRDLLAIDLDDSVGYSVDATSAVLGPDRFSRSGTSVVISTDDGSVGYKGFTTGALESYVNAQRLDVNDVVVYTCGPEIMMKGVAEYCLKQGITSYVCMERAMACGFGTCQSCVVEVYDDSAVDGWRYRLCCTEGPVFGGGEVCW